MLEGKRVVRREASWWRVEWREVVIRSFGGVWVFGMAKRVGKRRARVSGVRSRLALRLECAVGLVAREVALWGGMAPVDSLVGDGLRLGAGLAVITGDSVSLAESIMLSASSSFVSSVGFPWFLTSSSDGRNAGAPPSSSSSSSSPPSSSSSGFCRFRRSTSTLTPTKSPVSRSTASHTLLRSSVKGTFRFNRSSRNRGSWSSSRRRRNRSSRLA